MIALVPMEVKARLGMRFIDCVATYVRDDGADPEDGYAERPPVPDKHGDANPQFSEVSGYVGASVHVTVYPRQFDLPAPWGTRIDFHVGPGPILEACVQAIREEHFAPEYVI